MQNRITEAETPTSSPAIAKQVLAEVPSVCLAWATKKRHIAVDGNVLCEPKHNTAGYSVKNGQYNTISLSGLPTRIKTEDDVRFSHSDGFIEFKPLSEQKMKIDTKSICGKCLLKYEQELTRHFCQRLRYLRSGGIWLTVFTLGCAADVINALDWQHNSPRFLNTLLVAVR